jgi:O-methyltransferase involved in polyketide biosynthesis
MYLTREANQATLRDLATLAPGSTVAVTFLLPLDLVDELDRQGWVISRDGARSSGTPFVSLFRPEEFLDLARSAGFSDVRHVSGRELTASACRPARSSSSRPRSGSGCRPPPRHD